MRQRLARAWGHLYGKALDVRTWMRKYSAELSTAVVGLAGWFFLSLGLASLLGDVVWAFAIAVLCFSLFGWRLLRQVCLDGLYTLTHSEK